MSEPSMPDDRRHFKRIRFDCEASVELPDGQAQPVTLLDISLKGALIEKPAAWNLPEGSSMPLRVKLGEGGDEIRMECTVAHQENARIGFRCTHMDIDSAAHLRRVVELNLGDPELLNRELSALLR